MADTITVANVEAWLGSTLTFAETATCQLAVDAVLAYAAAYYPAPVDSLDAELDPWPDDYRLGLIMAVARLRKRSETPSGTITFDGFTDRVTTFDGDVDRLLAPYRVWSFG